MILCRKIRNVDQNIPNEKVAHSGGIEIHENKEFENILI